MEAIDRIVRSQHDVVVMDAPTGSGKSLIALGVARSTLEKTFIVTKNKSLQGQYIEEAGELAKTITGKNNYTCILLREDPGEARSLGVRKETTVDDAPCASGYTCNYRAVCPYFVDKRRAVRSPISIHNYSYLIPEMNYVGEFNHPGYVFADEGHLLDDVLTEFSSVEISRAVLDDHGGGPRASTLGAWVGYARGVVNELEKVKPVEEGVALTRWERRVEGFRRMRDLAVDGSTRWVLDYGVHGVKVRPLWPVGLRETILHGGKKLVVMSGTILDHEMFSEVMGIGDHTYMPLPWTFPKESRPVFYRPAAEVTRENMGVAAPNLARVVDHIISTHRGEKGVIHCRSFALGEAVARCMKYDRLLVHSRGMNRTEVVRRFKGSSMGTWLISPSVGHGEDFAYDLARCQVILKMPFPDYGDQLVRSRSRMNPAWYYYATAQELVQMIGRLTRAADDYGETYICDSKFDQFITKYSRFIPEAVWDAVN